MGVLGSSSSVGKKRKKKVFTYQKNKNKTKKQKKGCVLHWSINQLIVPMVIISASFVSAKNYISFKTLRGSLVGLKHWVLPNGHQFESPLGL